ncbi:hypothetical protein GCM10022237_01980 [Nocardioides ginsengisoli]|uniref:Nucleotidyltransferase substrate binding domain-containing protein n=1 Tax=Nocardioides ginsengisoli TaxID=363868 RepID=A0ABW3W6L4_9ACTN
MTVDVLATLATTPPFDQLTDAERRDLARGARVEQHADEVVLLDAFTAMPRHVFVIVSGKVDLWVEPEGPSEAPDLVLGPGDVFGLDATLTGRAIGPLAVSSGQVQVIRLSAAKVSELLAGDRPVVVPDRLAGPPASESPAYVVVDELVISEPVIVAPADRVIDVARTMTSANHGYAAVRLPQGWGMITDRMLRERVLAGDVRATTPVGELVVAETPNQVVSGSSAAEALIVLLDRRADYVLVVDRDGSLRGSVEPRDFMVSSTTAGVSLHEQLRRAGSVEELQTRARGIPGVLATLLDGGLASGKVITVHTAMLDTTVRRMVELIFARHPALDPDAFTWLSLGSNGRGEAVPSSDIDSAAAFDDAVTADDIVRYRLAFGEIADALAAAGLTGDQHGATAARPLFSRTNAAWRAAGEQWLAAPASNNGAMMTSLLVDGRPIYGDPGLPAVAQVFAGLRRHPGTMRLLLQESLSRRARMRVIRDRRDFDLKSHALLPIVNLARWAALSVGSSALPTTERLRAASGTTVLPTAQALALVEVFEVLQRLRLRHQLRQIEQGEAPSDRVDLQAVSAIDRSIISRAVREIAAVQRRMDNVALYDDPESWGR